MLNRSFLFAVGGVLVGCSAPPVMEPDAGPTLPACEVALSPQALEVSEGGRLQVELAPSAAVVDWKVVQADPFTALKIDGTHLQLKAPYGIRGNFSVSAQLDCGEEQKTQQWLVTVRALAWSRATTWTEGVDGPLDREYASMWVDDANPDRVLLFGGYVYKPQQFTPAHDLWELNLSDGKWKLLTPANEPPHSTGGRMALSPQSGQALYLGGIDEAQETPYQLSRFFYTADELRWESEPLASGSAGQGEYQPGFFYDAKRSRFVSVCGANNEVGRHCDVRAYTSGSGGGRWEAVPLAPGPVPPGRNGHFYAYDAETDRVIIFGGDAPGTTLGDTWALELAENPARWVQLANNDSSMRRRNGAFVLDAPNHRFIIMGGTATGAKSWTDMWVLDLDRGKEQWVRVEVPGKPPGRTSGTALYDAKRRRVLMGFGNSEIAEYPDLWALQL